MTTPLLTIPQLVLLGHEHSMESRKACALVDVLNSKATELKFAQLMGGMFAFNELPPPPPSLPPSPAGSIAGDENVVMVCL